MKKSESEVLLCCDALLKRFGDTVAAENINITLKHGELLAILGPSGCGKSTLLRMIAGLVRPDGGTLRYGETVWFDDSSFIVPEKRDCGMVFQDMALFPHLSVGGNVGFALSRRGRRDAVCKMLQLVNLEGMAERMVYQLSGGQQQRVALARSLAPKPGLLLLDEPATGLNPVETGELRDMILRIRSDLGITIFMIEHNMNLVASISDRVVVLNHGEKLAEGLPDCLKILLFHQIVDL